MQRTVLLRACLSNSHADERLRSAVDPIGGRL